MVDVLIGTPLVVITFEGEHVFEVNVLMGMLALLSNGYTLGCLLAVCVHKTITEQRKSFGMTGRCLPRFDFCFMLL